MFCFLPPLIFNPTSALSRFQFSKLMTSLFAPTSIYVTSVNDICKNENLTDNNKNTEYMSPCGSKNTINYAAQKSKSFA
jgi:hypothetical protein